MIAWSRLNARSRREITQASRSEDTHGRHDDSEWTEIHPAGKRKETRGVLSRLQEYKRKKERNESVSERKKKFDKL